MTLDEREILRKKMLYNSWHRGCKETDLLLGNFAREYLEQFSDEELMLYKVLLDEDDWDIFNWMTGKEPLPARLHNPVTEKLMAFRFAG